MYQLHYFNIETLGPKECDDRDHQYKAFGWNGMFWAMFEVWRSKYYESHRWPTYLYTRNFVSLQIYKGHAGEKNINCRGTTSSFHYKLGNISITYQS